MKQLIKDIRHTAVMYRKSIRLMRKITPSFYPVALGIQTAQIVKTYLLLWFSALLLDELLGAQNPRTLLSYTVLLLLSEFLLSALSNYLATRKDENQYFLYAQEENLFVQKIMSLDYEAIENTELQKTYSQIRESSHAGSNHNLLAVSWQIPGLYSAVLDLGISFWMLAGFVAQTSFPLWSWMLLAAVYAVSIWLNLKGGAKCEKEWHTYSAGIGGFCRARDALTEHMEAYSSGKNLRIFRGDKLALDSLAHWHHENDIAIDKHAQKDSRISFAFQDLPAFFSEAFVQCFTLSAALLGKITAGNIARYVACIQRSTESFKELGGLLTSMRYNVDFLDLYFSFLELPNRMKQGTLPVEKRHDNEYEIRFDHVSFRYPGSEEYALKDISLTFKVGEKMAIVGENGSGKTTFIKLLCRLYDPTEGTIYLNGMDIRKFNYKEYMELFSVVFQDFRLLAFSLGENIAVSEDYDQELAEDALEKAGLSDFFKNLPDGLDTSLYKDFGDEKGLEISGGEAQKIALARAIYKNAPFVLLDEPTAALDPVAEFEIYSRFQDIVGDRTTVFISHRLSSCRFCQDIAVFHEGRLVQRGNHEELISRTDGKYYELWNAQAQYYTA